VTTIAIDNRPRPRRHNHSREAVRLRIVGWLVVTVAASTACQVGLGGSLHGWFF
jgi:hypothetical protein